MSIEWSSRMMAEDEFLKHYGKKGMRWGVRRERTASDVSKDLLKIDKKQNSFRRQLIPAASIISGAGARAGAAKTVLKLEAVKGQYGNKRLVETSKTPKITDANREKYDRKIDRTAYAKYLGVGTLAVATLLATSYVAHTRISDEALSKMAVKGALVLAGAQVMQTSMVVAGINRNVADRHMYAKKKELTKELKSLS